MRHFLPPACWSLEKVQTWVNRLLRLFMLVFVAMPIGRLLVLFFLLISGHYADVSPFGHSEDSPWLMLPLAVGNTLLQVALAYVGWRILRYLCDYVGKVVRKVRFTDETYLTARNLLNGVALLAWAWLPIQVVFELGSSFLETNRPLSFLLMVGDGLGWPAMKFALMSCVLALVWRLLMTLLVVAESAEAKRTVASEEHA